MNKHHLETIGQRIRRARLARGLKIYELARLIRISASSLGHLELGNHNTNMYTFIDIAKQLGVSLDYLAFGGNDGNKDSNVSKECTATPTTGR